MPGFFYFFCNCCYNVIFEIQIAENVVNISEIKKDLQELDKQKLIDLVLNLAKLKKENKQAIVSALKSKDSLELYVDSVKEFIQSQFESVNPNPFFAKKTLRRIVKEIKSKSALMKSAYFEAELWIKYIAEYDQLQFVGSASRSMVVNTRKAAVLRIEKLLTKMHEEQQFDIRKELQMINKND